MDYDADEEEEDGGGEDGQLRDRPFFDGLELVRGPVVAGGAAGLRFAALQQLLRLGPTTELAFVRFLAPVAAHEARACSGPAGDVLSQHGATLLQWAARPGGAADVLYTVVPLGDVIQRVQLVRDFAAWEVINREWYRVNPFLWLRDRERSGQPMAVGASRQVGGGGGGGGGGTAADSGGGSGRGSEAEADEHSECSDGSHALVG